MSAPISSVSPVSPQTPVGYVVPVDAVEPRAAVELAALAEVCGFSGSMVADTFQPWLPRLGHAPHVWSLLGALAGQTRGDFGAGMVAAGSRAHPAVIAQAAATLASLYPGRHWIAMGTGEALHEHVTGEYWPEPADRVARLFEAVDVVRRLFAASAAGRDLRHRGEYFRMESTRIWTMPEQTPAVMVAASGPVTARRAGRSADGLLAVAVQPAQAALVLERFREGVNESGRDPASVPAWLHLNLSWASTPEEAVTQVAQRYPMAAMRFARGDLRSPLVVERIAELVRPADFVDRIMISEDLTAHAEMIRSYLALGYDRVFVHNVGADQQGFLRAFGESVLPTL